MAQQVSNTGDPVYEVEFWGQYATHTPGHYKNFRCKVLMDHRMVNEIGIGSTFKRYLGKALLPTIVDEKTGEKPYNDFRRLTKFHHGPAVKVSGKDYARRIDMMSREELINYAAGWMDGKGMAIELALYTSETELRTAIQEYEKDEPGFLKRQGEIMAKKGQKLKDEKEVLKLNGLDNSIDKGVKAKLPSPATRVKNKSKSEVTEDDYE